jgi:hypothetical protein
LVSALLPPAKNLNAHLRTHDGAFAAAGANIVFRHSHRMESPAIGGFGKDQVFFRAKMNAQTAGLAFVLINDDMTPGGIGFSHGLLSHRLELYRT